MIEEEGDKQRPGRCLLRLLCAMQQFKRPNWQVFSTGASKKNEKKGSVYIPFLTTLVHARVSVHPPLTGDSALLLGFACRRLARSLRSNGLQLQCDGP